MKQTFVQPRLVGGRFDEHTLPLEIARDLAAYEVLVVELAKTLYLREHPDRQRVPKGFGADFSLHIERMEDGSVKPVIAIVTAGLLALSTPVGEPFFTRSRDMIARCIAAESGHLPEEFPRELLTHFNQFGRSLRDGESMELPTSTGTAVLTPLRRKQLVLESSPLYERPIEVNGWVIEVNWDRQTFQLKLGNGTRVTVPLHANISHRIGVIGGSDRHQVTVTGVGKYDANEDLKELASVTSLDLQADYYIASRFEMLRGLEQGWFDGAGVAFNQNAVDNVSSNLVGKYPQQLPLPTIVPTPEGNLLFEWDAPGDPSVDLNLTDMHAAFHAFGEEMSDIEDEFKLDSQEAWAEFFTYLEKRIS